MLHSAEKSHAVQPCWYKLVFSSWYISVVTLLFFLRNLLLGRQRIACFPCQSSSTSLVPNKRHGKIQLWQIFQDCYLTACLGRVQYFPLFFQTVVDDHCHLHWVFLEVILALDTQYIVKVHTHHFLSFSNFQTGKIRA